MSNADSIFLARKSNSYFKWGWDVKIDIIDWTAIYYFRLIFDS